MIIYRFAFVINNELHTEKHKSVTAVLLCQVVCFYSVPPVIGTLIMLNKQEQGFIIIL